MKKILFLIGLVSLFLSCKKEVIGPVFDSVTISEKVNQITFSDKPDFEIAYFKNTVINGEVTIQLLDKNGTRLYFLPNSNLISENGIISINNVPYLENEEYLFKISNFNYNNSYYQFNTDADTSYKDEVFIKFYPTIKNNVTNVSMETFDLNVQDNLGFQKAIEYGCKINNREVDLNELDFFITVRESQPWYIFENILIRDSDGLLIKERYIGDQSDWIEHNDSLFELKLDNINYYINTGVFKQNIEMEIKNCIDTMKMQIKLKTVYIENGKREYFETRNDSLRIKEF